MEPKILGALENSIIKWNDICMGEGVDNGCDNCALCEMFRMDDCTGCPAGELWCSDTPYDKWHRIWSKTRLIKKDCLKNVNWGWKSRNLIAALVIAAEEELIYLLGLLPEGHEWRKQI